MVDVVCVFLLCFFLDGVVLEVGVVCCICVCVVLLCVMMVDDRFENVLEVCLGIVSVCVGCEVLCVGCFNCVVCVLGEVVKVCEGIDVDVMCVVECLCGVW